MMLYSIVWNKLPDRCSVKELKYILGANFKVRSENVWAFMEEMRFQGFPFTLTNRGFRKETPMGSLLRFDI